MGQIAAAVLAAGWGSRFISGHPKMLAPLGGRPLVSHALDAAIESELKPVILVVGHNSAEIAAIASPNVVVVHNKTWQQGIAWSLRTALSLLEPGDVEALCVGLGDQPFIGAESYRRLAAAYSQGACFAVATYRGARRNPVLLARSLWSEAMQLTGDEGARVLMRVHPVVEVACDDTGNPFDIDTLDDLKVVESQTEGKL